MWEGKKYRKKNGGLGVRAVYFELEEGDGVRDLDVFGLWYWAEPIAAFAGFLWVVLELSDLFFEGRSVVEIEGVV